MNHCLIQSVIKTNPQMRYTKENQTPIAEMMVSIKDYAMMIQLTT